MIFSFVLLRRRLFFWWRLLLDDSHESPLDFVQVLGRLQ